GVGAPRVGGGGGEGRRRPLPGGLGGGARRLGWWGRSHGCLAIACECTPSRKQPYGVTERRSAVIRSLRPRSRLSLIGVCSRCGVRFRALPADAADTRIFFEAHERVCPGGRRRRVVVIPLGPVREIRVVRGSA